MQKLYFELLPFYQKFLKRNESYVVNVAERHDITLSFFIKLLSLVLFLRSDVKYNVISSKNIKAKDFRKLLHTILFNSSNSYNTSIVKGLELFFNIIRLDYLEAQMKDALSNSDWDNLVSSLLKYNYSLEESFLEETGHDDTITPGFLSCFVESILNDYERLFSLKIKPKLSRRKNRGSFYTPWSIVRNITLECFSTYFKDSSTSYISNIRILDPACGTGSFLVYSAETLYIKKYNQEEALEDIMNIVRDNIYGVDTSSISIFVTKMRLLLWLVSKYKDNPLEIPNDLLRNLRVGNSLFGLVNEVGQYPLDYTTILEKIMAEIHNIGHIEGSLDWLKVCNVLRKSQPSTTNGESRKSNALQLMEKLLDNMYLNWLLARVNRTISKKLKGSDIKKVNFFHWGLAFPEVIQDGGFDLIVGNPPYGRSVLTPEEKKCIKVIYKSCFGKNKKYSLNSASAFIERSILLLKKNGILGFILPYSILRVEEFEKLRTFILSETQIISIRDEANAFSDVTLEMCSLILLKQKLDNYSIKIEPRMGIKANHTVNSKVFHEYNRFMIYYDELWESCYKIGTINIVSGDYGIDHRIIGKDLTPIHSPRYHVVFLHSGKCVRKYGLNPKYFLFSKPHPINLRFNLYFKEPRLISTAIGNKLRVAYKPEKIIPGTNVSILEVPKDYHYLPMLLILNSNLINYLLKRYILNFSSLTVYLHKYYTKLLPIKYPFEDEDTWKILASYLLFLTQLDLSLGQVYEKRINYLEQLSNYLVYELYFPSFSASDEKLVEIMKSILKPINLGTFYDLIFGISSKSSTDNKTLEHIIRINKKTIFKSMSLMKNHFVLKRILTNFKKNNLIIKINSEI